MNKPTTHSAHWQQQLAQCITDPQELWQLLRLDPNTLPDAIKAQKLFKLRIPRNFITRIQPGNIRDPLLLQALPLFQETLQDPSFTHDPVNEQQQSPLPGLLHKYANRVLLIVTAGCAIHCRYCFRRHFSYADHMMGQAAITTAIDYIKQDISIREVILSGGDPFTLKDAQLKTLVQQLATIPHLKRLRIHTRLPLMIPARITPELLNLLTATRLQSIVVIHSNHPQEIDAEVGQALKHLHQAHITLLNQSVLLRGINDDATCLIRLSERLFEHHVLPYYIHMLDKVTGTQHFEVDDALARQLMQELAAQLPGYLVPKLVREVAGEKYKIPL